MWLGMLWTEEETESQSENTAVVADRNRAWEESSQLTDDAWGVHSDYKDTICLLAFRCGIGKVISVGLAELKQIFVGP